MFCDQCGAKVEGEARFCSACGNACNGAARTSHAWDPHQQRSLSDDKSPRFAEGRNRFLALFLSLMIVGMGQFYNGDFKKGGFMLVGAIVGGFISFSALWWVMALWSALDAYQVAKGSKALWR